MKNNRTILRTSESHRNRESIPLYKVEDLAFSPEGLREGYKYEVTYRYGRTKKTSLGRYYGCTEDARTLIFHRLDGSGISLGIPSMNIYVIDRIGL